MFKECKHLHIRIVAFASKFRVLCLFLLYLRGTVLVFIILRTYHLRAAHTMYFFYNIHTYTNLSCSLFPRTVGLTGHDNMLRRQKRVLIGLASLLAVVTIISWKQYAALHLHHHHHRGLGRLYETQGFLNGAFTLPTKTLVIYVYHERYVQCS